MRFYFFSVVEGGAFIIEWELLGGLCVRRGVCFIILVTRPVEKVRWG